MRVAIVTVGCPKNTADSDLLSSHAAAAGLDIVDDPLEADAIVVNTCGFIAAACEESLDTILELAELKSEGKCRLLMVCGCMVERYPGQLEEDLPEVDVFFGLAEPCAADIARCLTAEAGAAAGTPRAVVSRTFPATSYAYVKISDGCDRSCTFCTIPAIRGRYRSRQAKEIETEVAVLVKQGVREIILVGQETSKWGSDLGGNESLPWLLARLACRESTWFRVMYLQPDGVTDDLIETIATLDNVCSYFDIPFQHAQQSILRRMGRGGGMADFLDLIGRVRERIRDVALRTSLIVGFPGETDTDFAAMCAFVREARIDYAGVFAYSPEQGTKAAELAGAVDADTVAERLRMLSDLAFEIGSQRVAERVGSGLDVVVDARQVEQEYRSEGRSQFQAPEIDGVCLLRHELTPGRIVSVRVKETDGYDMICYPV